MMIQPADPIVAHLLSRGFSRLAEHAFWHPGGPAKISATASNPATKLSLRGWGGSSGEAWADLLRRAGLVVPEPGPAPVPAPSRRPRVDAPAPVGLAIGKAKSPR